MQANFETDIRGYMNDHLFGKEMFIRFTASAFRKTLSIYVFSYLPFSFWGQDVGSDCISSWSLIIVLLHSSLREKLKIRLIVFEHFFFFFHKLQSEQAYFLSNFNPNCYDQNAVVFAIFWPQ